MIKDLLLRPAVNKLKELSVRVVPINEAFEGIERQNPVPSEIISTPETQEMRFLANAERFRADYYRTPFGYTALLEGVLYCPEYSVILTKDRKVISECFVVPQAKKDFKLQHLYNLKIEKVPGCSVIFHNTKNNYYHTIIDNLPRFYLACQNEAVKNSEEVKLIHSRHLSEFDKFYLSKLKPSNVHVTPVQKGRLYELEKLVFAPFLSTRNNGCLPPSYREEIFSNVLPKRLRHKKERIYISRERAYNARHILNEEELLNSLKKLGFKKYILEDLSISEQIELFYDAETVIGAHGAGMINILFADKINVLELFPGQFVIPTYYYLSKSMGHTYQYWGGKETAANSNFVVDVRQITMQLERMESMVSR